MGTEKMNLVPTTTPTPTHQQGGPPLNNPHLLFHHDDTTTSALHRFAPLHRHSGDPGPKTTRELTTGFIDDPHRFFQPPPDFRRPLYASHPWNVNGRPTAHGSDGDEDEDDDDDDDEEELDDGDGELKIINHNSSNTSSSRDLLMKEGNLVPSGDDGKNNNNDNNVRAVRSCENQASQFENATAITIADPDGNLYYPHQYLHGTEEGSAAAAGHKDVSLVENGCGFSGRKDVSYSSAGESLRGILSDPLTGSLMDDAMILPCGHSFGGGGMQHVIRMKACYTCSQPMSEDSVAANLSLRAAVQAFRREEELQVYPASKRRREKFEQDKSGHGDLAFTDPPRGRGVQFPFVVTDRVIIKGNKRTPPRFVGREAVVTTQCLNGWYVVKTLDNAESVKLQYRSLAKVADDSIPKPISSKMTPNWL